MLDFVTDRTEADVLLGNQKGRYTYNDLNRVEQDVRELAEMASSLGMAVEVSTKTDWGTPGMFDAEKWPTESQMTRYLGNVKRLADLVAAGAGLPPTMAALDWEGANDIEATLQIVHIRLQGIIKAWKYSGEKYAGEE